MQIHPTCIPVSGDYQSKLTLMSESLRNDGRVWVPRTKGEKRLPGDIPDDERYYYLEERYPTFGNLVPRDVASRAAKVVCDDGFGVGDSGYSVYLDFRDAINKQGQHVIAEKYGNLFDMYEEITGESPYQQPFRIYPAVHYCMGGLWVDYNLQTTIPGLYAIGESNFSDHGANRLGASSLMQCLADGYFILPQTIGDGLQPLFRDKVDTDHPEFARIESEVKDRIKRVMSIKGDSTPLSIHKRLGKQLWDHCGMSRNAAGLQGAIDSIGQLSDEFWSNLKITGESNDINQTLERAMRVSDFLKSDHSCKDALSRDESCGCHFREEHQTDEGEVVRNDEDFAHVAAWEWQGEGEEHVRGVEPLDFEELQPATRSYK